MAVGKAVTARRVLAPITYARDRHLMIWHHGVGGPAARSRTLWQAEGIYRAPCLQPWVGKAACLPLCHRRRRLLRCSSQPCTLLPSLPPAWLWTAADEPSTSRALRIATPTGLTPLGGASTISPYEAPAAQYEDVWVTVFGFTSADVNLVLQEFSKCGDVLQWGTFGQPQVRVVWGAGRGAGVVVPSMVMGGTPRQWSKGRGGPGAVAVSAGSRPRPMLVASPCCVVRGAGPPGCTGAGAGTSTGFRCRKHPLPVYHTHCTGWRSCAHRCAALYVRRRVLYHRPTSCTCSTKTSTARSARCCGAASC